MSGRGGGPVARGEVLEPVLPGRDGRERAGDGLPRAVQPGADLLHPLQRVLAAARDRADQLEHPEAEGGAADREQRGAHRVSEAHQPAAGRRRGQRGGAGDPVLHVLVEGELGGDSPHGHAVHDDGRACDGGGRAAGPEREHPGGVSALRDDADVGERGGGQAVELVHGDGPAHPPHAQRAHVQRVLLLQWRGVVRPLRQLGRGEALLLPGLRRAEGRSLLEDGSAAEAVRRGVLAGAAHARLLLHLVDQQPDAAQPHVPVRAGGRDREAPRAAGGGGRGGGGLPPLLPRGVRRAVLPRGPVHLPAVRNHTRGAETNTGGREQVLPRLLAELLDRNNCRDGGAH